MSQKLWLEPQGVWAQLGPRCCPHGARRLGEKRHRPPCVPRGTRGASLRESQGNGTPGVTGSASPFLQRKKKGHWDFGRDCASVDELGEK